MMQGSTVLLVLAAVVFSATGQLLLKAGAQDLGALGHLDYLVVASRDARILAGLVAWAVSTLCWLYVLRVAPLSRAYGLTSLTYVLVLVASVGLLGEEVRRVHVAGTILIAVGIACLLVGD